MKTPNKNSTPDKPSTVTPKSTKLKVVPKVTPIDAKRVLKHDTPMNKKLMDALNKKMAFASEIVVHPHFSFRSSFDVQAEIAKKNKGWTLFINERGNLCYGVCPTGIRIGPFRSPEYLHNVQVEHTVNYFLNTLRSILPPL